MKKIVFCLIVLFSQNLSAAPNDMDSYLRRYQIHNCLKVKENVPNLSIKKGEIVKVNNSRLGNFEISRPLISTAEIEDFCRKNKDIATIGSLNGEKFEKWPQIILAQNENDIIERCFIIDGPANIREEPKSKVIESLNDYEVVKVIKKEGDWFLISEPIKQLGGDYYFPLRCFTSTKLKSIGWTHKSNLKFFPVPLIMKTNKGVKVLKIKNIILEALSMREMGMGKLSINFFKNSKVKSLYFGGLVVDKGDMEKPDAYLINETHIKKIEYEGEFIRVTNKGFVVTNRVLQPGDGSCEVIATLIHPNEKAEVIKKQIQEAAFCGAG